MSIAPNYAVGIDLGTTYSCVAVFMNGNATVIANENGNRTIPSVVALLESGRFAVGEAAVQEHNSSGIAREVKRLMGRKHSDLKVQEALERKKYKFALLQKENERIAIELKNGEAAVERTPEEISSLILENLIQTASYYLNAKDLKDAVITVPAYFDEAQRAATKAAAEVAGINLLRLLSEPTAAAVGHVYHTKQKEKKTYLVYDFGGGTFDVSVLTHENGVFTVLATIGDTYLGGADLDEQLLSHAVEHINKLHRVDLSENERALSRLEEKCEQAKRYLSKASMAAMSVDYLTAALSYKTELSRAKFNYIGEDIFNRTIQLVKQLFEDNSLQYKDIDEVLMVGGSSKIPKLEELLSELFPNEKIVNWVERDEAVARGAAIVAAKLSGNGGADMKNFEIRDVTPLSIGIEITHGHMSTIVKRNTPIPTKESQVFATANDDQTSILFKVYQGERPLTTDNLFLDQFHLRGIPRAPRGLGRVKVTCHIDANGMVVVEAKEPITGTTAVIEITRRGKLSEAEIALMLQKAAANREVDRQTKAKGEARRELEEYLYDLKLKLKNKKLTWLDEARQKSLDAAIETNLRWINDKRDTAAVEEYRARLNAVKSLASQ